MADVELSITSNSGAPGGQVAEFQVIGTPAPNPDLTVTSSSWTPPSPVETDTITASATVANSGTASSGATNVNFYLGTTKVGTANVPALNAGASTTVSASMYLARRAGIRLLATGAIGGAARRDGSVEGHVWDISADLVELLRASGELNALAIMTRERVGVLPDLPTAVETVPGLVAIGWVGIFAPKGVPEAIVQRLAASIRQTMEAPEVKARYEQTGTPVQPLFTDEFARFIEADQKLWWPVVKEAETN